MRKHTIIIIALILSLIFSQVLVAGVFAQHHTSTKSTQSQDTQIQKDAAQNQHLMDCMDYLSNESTGEDLLHVYCHCPAMSVSCSVSVLLDHSAGLEIPVRSLSYSISFDSDTLCGRELDVELRPPKRTS